jgi:eukaryotic-like serine/threonine-protein kinase
MGFHVGQTFGDYSITAVVGAGGMGRLYKVQHTLTGRTEAMKVLSAELATDVQVKRFEREMRALAKLRHPNIAALHNATYSENQLVLLMEYIEGDTLEDIFAAGRPSLDIGLGYIRQTLAALGYAHAQGVVHRDVTPANLLVTPEGQIKLTDFGLSKSYGDQLVTNCGEILGSLPYLAPEQLKGVTHPDRRSDLYAVGAILYELLTGQKPFGANRRLAPVLTDTEPDPEPPSRLAANLAREWDEIIRCALARDPMHRYQGAEDFDQAIAQFEQQTATRAVRQPSRSIGVGVAIAAALILALVASPAAIESSEARFGPAQPITVPREKLHIAPPDFATELAPRAAERAAKARPRRDASAADVAARSETDDEPETVEQAYESPAPAPAPKKGFWSKMNIFKRKKGADGN